MTSSGLSCDKFRVKLWQVPGLNCGKVRLCFGEGRVKLWRRFLIEFASNCDIISYVNNIKMIKIMRFSYLNCDRLRGMTSPKLMTSRIYNLKKMSKIKWCARTSTVGWSAPPFATHNSHLVADGILPKGGFWIVTMYVRVEMRIKFFELYFRLCFFFFLPTAHGSHFQWSWTSSRNTP